MRATTTVQTPGEGLNEAGAVVGVVVVSHVVVEAGTVEILEVVMQVSNIC